MQCLSVAVAPTFGSTAFAGDLGTVMQAVAEEIGPIPDAMPDAGYVKFVSHLLTELCAAGISLSEVCSVHGNIEPANIQLHLPSDRIELDSSGHILGGDMSQCQVKLDDCGNAHVLSAGTQAALGFYRAPEYSAPEALLPEHVPPYDAEDPDLDCYPTMGAQGLLTSQTDVAAVCTAGIELLCFMAPGTLGSARRRKGRRCV